AEEQAPGDLTIGESSASQLGDPDLRRRQLCRGLPQVRALQLRTRSGSPHWRADLLERFECLSERDAGVLTQLATPLDPSNAQPRSSELERHLESLEQFQCALQVRGAADQVAPGGQQQPTAALTSRERPDPINRPRALLEHIEHELGAVELA